MPGMSPRTKMRKGRFGPGGFKPPVVKIRYPGNLVNVGPGSPATQLFVATAADDFLGDISETVQWSSDQVGSPEILATGSSVDLGVFLVPGSPAILQIITASALDGIGRVGSDSVGIRVQNGASLPDIFLRSTSAWYNKDVDKGAGSPGQFTIQAPIRQTNDFLFLMKAGFGQNVSPPTGWIAFPQYTNNYLQIFYRVATNTAADNFEISETTTRNVVAQMACFASVGGDMSTLGQTQGGFLSNRATGADTAYDLLSITAATNNDQLVLAWYMTEKNATLVGSPTSPVSIDTSPVDLPNEIGSIAYEQTTAPVGTIWAGWSWGYDETPTAHSAAEITYFPLQEFRVETTQYTKWKL